MSGTIGVAAGCNVVGGAAARARGTTGTLWPSRAGFVVDGSVTKKVALVVAADPDTLSGKVRKARDYSIPVVGERSLEVLLGSE